MPVSTHPSPEYVNDPYLSMAAGRNPLISEISQVNKFGENPDIANSTTEDVWDGGGTYSYPTTALMTSMSQTTDQAAMQGATIELQGLDASWDLIVQTKALDASDTTTVITLDTPMIRCFRMKVLANVVSDQDIRCHNAGETVDYAIIQAGNNQTLMALYTVPNGKTAYMSQWYSDNVPTSTKKPDSVNFTLWMADRANSYEFQVKSKRGIPISGPGFNHPFRPYLKITQKTDIRINALVNGGAGDDGNPHSGYDLIMIDN